MLFLLYNTNTNTNTNTNIKINIFNIIIIEENLKILPKITRQNGSSKLNLFI